jgi:enoyl-CoA hydratase/carnithine racemase
MYEAIDYTVEGPIATITLNRPDRLNAITGQMIKEIQDAIGRADADERVVDIILTGSGRGFCAGGDIESLYRSSVKAGRSQPGKWAIKTRVHCRTWAGLPG